MIPGPTLAFVGGGRLPTLQSDALAHYPNRVDGIHEYFGWRGEPISVIEFDHVVPVFDLFCGSLAQRQEAENQFPARPHLLRFTDDQVQGREGVQVPLHRLGGFVGVGFG